MDPNSNTPPTDESQPPASQAPADALSRTPEDLEQDPSVQAAKAADIKAAEDPSAKKVSPIKKFFRKVNVYFLIFVLIVVVAGVIAVVNYLNSQKAPEEPNIATQSLTQDALKQLANTDATVGSASQTLNIQGNAIIAGQTLTRGNLNVAGNFQSGGPITAPSITTSGAANLGTIQTNNLQVATDVAIQGKTTVRDLNVAGTTSLSGAVTASQITVSQLILSGNASLRIPNHISFTGPSPGRSISASVLGSGGSASINGSDTTGTVNINTGGGPQPGCFVQITFAQKFSNQPHVLVSPVGAGAGQLQYYVERSQSGFSICTNNAAPANQVFAFDYFVTN
ncbi:hypothetical protein EYC58_02400 [Candidatus Saccharibacteria bacterium]|nr:MAG: hypothetical protein EYC58_02400 [Candidatus Saccharibacteria bacterium]